MHIKRTTVVLDASAAAAVLLFQGVAAATESPTTGQPGAPGTTCFSSAATSDAPGHTTTAAGAPFNGRGRSGAVYAGNPGTASATHSNSTVAVSQYDVACLQVTSHSH